MGGAGGGVGVTRGLARLAAVLAPGSRVANVRRLRGGIDAAVHALDLVGPNGERRRLVARRCPADGTGRWRRATLRAWQMLEALERLGFPAPRPVLLDAEGDLLGGAALVMTRLPGRGLLAPRDPGAWAQQLGETLAALHRTPIERLELSFVEGPRTRLERALGEAVRRAGQCDDPIGAVLGAALPRWRAEVELGRPTLVHGDYWAGNTLWWRGRLVGVVDWEEAGPGYPGQDLGYCRLDLFTLHGARVADAFLAAYEAAMGERVRQLAFWDLLGAAVALPDPERWLGGYHDLGRTEITPRAMRERTLAFIRQALQRGLE